MLPFDPPAYLALPSPISTNNLFGNAPGRGRVITKEYTAWRKLASDYLRAQAPLPRFAVPVDIMLFVGERGVGNMDSDNTAKAYIDAMKKAQIIHDDSRKWVRSSQAIWTPDIAGCVAAITPADEAPRIEDVVRYLRPVGRELVLA